MNNQPNIIKNKSYQFSLDIIDMYKKMISQKEFILSKQLLHAGTSVGANVEEAAAPIYFKDIINGFKGLKRGQKEINLFESELKKNTSESP